MTRRRDNPLLAWHASPYDLPEGRFGEMRQVSGKGQGAAAYGRGAAYLAENPKVSGPGESEYMKEFRSHPTIRDDHDEYLNPSEMPGLRYNGIDLTELHKVRLTDKERYRKLMDLAGLDRGRAHLLPHLHAILDMYQDVWRDSRTRPDLKGIFDTWRDEVDKYHYSDDPENDIDQKNKRTHLQELDELKSQVLDYTRQHGEERAEKGGYRGPYSYKVALHLGEDNLLDWDHRMDQHSEGVIDKIAHLGFQPSDNGSELYRKLSSRHGSDFAATEALLKAGIHGIRYKDGGSRNATPDLHYKGAPVKLEFLGQGLTPPVVKVAHTFKDREHTSLDETIQFYRNLAEKVRQDGTRNNEPLSPLVAKYHGLADWAEQHRGDLTIHHPTPTYNYVVFHPDFIEALEQYDIQGRRVKAFAPKGVKLKSVDHDPFDGEGK